MHSGVPTSARRYVATLPALPVYFSLSICPVRATNSTIKSKLVRTLLFQKVRIVVRVGQCCADDRLLCRHWAFISACLLYVSAPDNKPPPPTYAQLQDVNRQGTDYEQIHLGLPTMTTTTTTAARTPAAEREQDYYNVSSSLSPAVVQSVDSPYEVLNADTLQTRAPVYDQLEQPT